MSGFTILLILIALCSPAPEERQAAKGTAPPPLLKPFGTMTEQRASHAATLLPDGRVLITGGFRKEHGGEDETYSSTAEVFDPRTKKFGYTGEMSYTRGGHTATLLTGGLVLITGGWNLMGVLSSAELYDPASEKFTTIGSMSIRRGGCTATLLNDGRVLICGGTGRDVTASAELFDPVRKSFTPTGSMTVPRYSHTATLLPGGRVLVAGGLTRRDAVLASAEVYDPGTGTFSAVGDMAEQRCKQAAVGLSGGEILILGGTDQTAWRGDLALIERFDPERGNFIRIPDMKRPRARFGMAVAPLADGSLIVAGGDRAIELLNSAGGEAEPSIIASLDRTYSYSTATTLYAGSVLILGGYDEKGETTDRAWLFRK
jgi:hypothetical protein